MRVHVPDGLEGWLLSAARCAAQWSYRDLVEESGVALNAIQRLEMLPEWEINRGERGRRYAGTVELATAQALLMAFEKVGLELRPKRAHQPAAVICVDPTKLDRRRAREQEQRKAMREQ